MKGVLVRNDETRSRIEIVGFVLDRYGHPDVAIRVEGDDPSLLRVMHWSWILPDDPQKVAESIVRLTPQVDAISIKECLEVFDDLKKRA